MLRSLARDPELDAHVRASVPAEVIEAIEQGGSLSWLPFSHSLAVRAAHVELRGWEDARMHYVAHFLEFSQSTLMRALAATLEAIFGIRGDAVHRVYPRIWSAFCRGTGEVVGEIVEPGRTRLRFEGVPLHLEGCECIFMVHEAALLAMFGYADLDVKLERRGTGAETEIELRW